MRKFIEVSGLVPGSFCFLHSSSIFFYSFFDDLNQ
jgi:hypothetical protein